MSGIVNFVKEHPVGISVSVVALGVVYLLVNSGGSNAPSVSAPPGPDAAIVAANNNLAGIQLQAQAHTNEINAQANVAGQQIAGQVTAATLDAQTAQNYNLLAAHASEYEAGLTAQTSQLISTLNARVTDNQTAAAVQTATIQANAYTSMNAQSVAAQIAIASAPYNAQVAIATLQEKAYEASLPTNAQILALQNSLAGLTTTVNAQGQHITTLDTYAHTTETNLEHYATAVNQSIIEVSGNIGSQANTIFKNNPLAITTNANGNPFVSPALGTQPHY